MILLENNSENLRSISQIFTSPSFRKILSNDDFGIMDNRVSKFLKIDNDCSRKELIQWMYSCLFHNYRSEYFYKNTLLNKILLGKYSTNTSTAFDEFKIASSIADFVVLNGEAKVYEIKTELDSLDKLDKQLYDYSKFANRINVVTNSKFVSVLTEKYLGTNVGLIELTAKKTLKTIIEAKSSNTNFEHEAIFKTLRKKEYLNIVFNVFRFVPDVPNTLIFNECLNLLKTIPVNDFQMLAVRELKKRKLKCPDYINSNDIPYELKYICHTLDLKEEQYEKLQEFLNQNHKICITHS